MTKPEIERAAICLRLQRHDLTADGECLKCRVKYEVEGDGNLTVSRRKQ